MLLNRKDNRQKVQYEKKANHGVQTAKVHEVKIGSDKNDNNYLILSLECESGMFSKYYMKPFFSDYMPFEFEDVETKNTIYWESCDKRVDELYRFIQLFDKSTIDDEGYIEYNFAIEFKKFLTELPKSLKLTVTEKNCSSFGFVKSKRKVTKQKFLKDETYTAYVDRIEGGEKDTWYEETGTPSLAYKDLIGESIPNYEDVEYWNTFYAFVAEYFGELQKTDRLDLEFIVKLIRTESPEYEKDNDNKVIKIDGKKVIKTMYYPVSTPETIWFKSVNSKNFDLKLNKRELELIGKYESQRNIANVDGNEITEITEELNLPF